ncbi:MAG TPA: response regulator transcription factor [Williamwhitmania sp.]|nr:response regulator transcription factor [Williamwhitmania sp.]
MEQVYKILLVDDENDILEFVGYNLRKEGFDVYTASNGMEAIRLAEEVMPHLILLDVMMPEMDGIETCEVIRHNPKLKNIFVAFLTARGEDYSQIAGFEAGGDDYIAKPIKPKVLVSRIKAMLKRLDSNIVDTRGESQLINIAGIVIDKERYMVVKEGEDLVLPKKEFELLALLHSKPNKVFTREEIFSSIWGDNIIVGDRTIDVHIRKLREKIGDDYIKTIKGVGYKFVD